mgnify:FL=1
MIERCPVCGGHLAADKRGRGLFRRGRRVVRCDSCRSVLRERGRNRWHYAVDPGPHPDLYRRVNGRYLTEEELEALLIAPAARATATVEAMPPPEASPYPTEVPPEAEEATSPPPEAEPAWEGEAVPPEPSEPLPLASPALLAESEAPAASPLVEPEIAEPEPRPAEAQLPESDAHLESAPHDSASLQPDSESPAEPEPASFEAPRFIEDDEWDDA